MPIEMQQVPSIGKTGSFAVKNTIEVRCLLVGQHRSECRLASGRLSPFPRGNAPAVDPIQLDPIMISTSFISDYQSQFLWFFP